MNDQPHRRTDRSRPVSGRTVEGFRVLETMYHASQRLPRHRHELPRLTIVMAGGFREVFRTDTIETVAGDVVIKPPQEAHRNEFGTGPTRCLLIEVLPERAATLEDAGAALDRVENLGRFDGGAWAREVVREYRCGDDAATLSLEASFLHLLARLARIARAGVNEPYPPWLDQALELMHDAFATPLRVRDIATVVGVHPTHLARTFRMHVGVQPGAYLRRLRVDRACELLTRTDDPLHRIALGTGFSDQSHFTRVFRSATGLTPGQYRSTHTG